MKIIIDEEVAKQALDALSSLIFSTPYAGKYGDAITALRSALDAEKMTLLHLEWELGYPEDVAFGTQRQMNRLKKWLDKYFAMIQALEALVRERDELQALNNRMLVEYEQRMEQLTACQKDAERYRELRSNELFSVDVKCPDGNWEPIHYEQLDAAIDEAMK